MRKCIIIKRLRQNRSRRQKRNKKAERIGNSIKNNIKCQRAKDPGIGKS